MAGKHDEFDDFFGDDDAPVVDTRADGRLYRVPLGRLSPNLVNPRTDFGAEDQLIDFGKSLARRQNQPCPVVSRGAYLKLWPDHARQIADVDYVLVSGERRYRAATAVGLAGLDCVVNDDVARDRKTFMEAVVSENVDRQNFDRIEEAYAVQALVAEFGTNRAVAQHFERADGWVTQRILLTHLAPELQTMVRKKTLPLEFARHLGKLTRDNGLSTQEQMDWWSETRRTQFGKAEERKAAKKAAETAVPSTTLMPTVAAPEPTSAVAQANPASEISQPGPQKEAPPAASPPPSPAHVEPQSFTAVKLEEPAAADDNRSDPQPTVGEPSTEPPVAVVMPWHNPTAVLRILCEHMQPADLERLVKEYAELS